MYFYVINHADGIDTASKYLVVISEMEISPVFPELCFPSKLLIFEEVCDCDAS